MFKLLIRVPLNNIHELESATSIQTWIDYRVKFWTLMYVIKKSLEMQIYCLKIHNKCLRHLVLINLRNDHLCIYRSWYRIYRFNEFTYLAIFGQTVICFYIKEEKHTCYILCWFRASFQILNGEQTMTPHPFPKRTHVPFAYKKKYRETFVVICICMELFRYFSFRYILTQPVYILKCLYILFFCYMWKLQIEESCFVISSWLKDSTYRIIEKLNDTIK